MPTHSGIGRRGARMEARSSATRWTSRIVNTALIVDKAIKKFTRFIFLFYFVELVWLIWTKILFGFWTKNYCIQMEIQIVT
jgi:hypothetical protein